MKNIFDQKHVKGVRAYALLLNGKLAGKVIANFSDNPAGSVCTADLIVWAGPLKNSEDNRKMERAGGYGYDKLAACLSRLDKRISEGNWEASIRELGYEVEAII